MTKPSRKSETKKTEGWVWCGGTKDAWHYVRNCRSLCGKASIAKMPEASYFEPPLPDRKHPAQCFGCEMKRLEEVGE